MDGRLRDDGVVVGGDARQRLHDARGYGRPLGGREVHLSRVEAAHLLFRGDLDAVDGMGFREFLVASAADGFAARFLVYADLRDRGFYLSPVGEGHGDADSEGATGGADDPTGVDFVVYPRGKGADDGEVLYRVRVVGERATLSAADLGDVVLAVVDEESEITYFETGEPAPAGESAAALPAGVEASLLGDRVVAWDPPDRLHDRGFYGQPLTGRSADADALQLSLVEAAYLAAEGALVFPGTDRPAAVAAVERGRAVEGGRFDRRLRVYRALRERGLVPKTGFKFGADFRVYEAFESVDEVGHSEWLVRVVPPDWTVSPRDLALDVRLAHGVRKRMAFALAGASDDEDRDGEDEGPVREERPDDGSVRWLSVERLTP